MRMHALALAATLLAAAPAFAGDPSYEFKDVTKPPAPDPQHPTLWKANMTAGLVWAEGNAESIGFSGTLQAGVRHWDNEINVNGGGAYVRTGVSRYGTGGPITEHRTSTENWLAKARYDRYFFQKNTVFASFQANGDRPAGFEYRLEPQVGYARLFWLSARQVFRGEIGYDYTRQHNVPMSTPLDVDYHSGRVFLYYENKFTPYASFSEGLELLEAFNHLEGFRLNSLTSISSALYKNISIKLNLKLAFNNDPPARPGTLVDPVTMLPFIPPADDSHFDKLDSELDLVLAVTFL